MRAATLKAPYKFTIGSDFTEVTANSSTGNSMILLTELFDDYLYAMQVCVCHGGEEGVSESMQESGLDVVETIGPLANYAMGFEFWYPDDTVTSTGIPTASLPPSLSLCHATTTTEEGVKSASKTVFPNVVGSVLLSKQTGRYRVQCDSMSGLTLIASELEKRYETRVRSDTTRG